MNPFSGHPFPPLVRWVVAPGFLAAAGAAGGAGAASLNSELPLRAVMLSGAALAAAAAMTLAVTAKPWATLLGGPVFGVFAIVSIVVASGGGPPDRVVSGMFREPRTLFILVAAVEGLLIPHLVYLRSPIRRWGGALAAYLAAGFLWPFFSLTFGGGGIRNQDRALLLFGILVGASQLPALMAARAVAARLTRPETGEGSDLGG